MKRLEYFVNEKLKISKKRNTYTLFPKTTNELQKMIIDEVTNNGPNCSLNHIDVSAITDMSYLFNTHNYTIKRFNGDISKWDVSRVEDMSDMFALSEFTGEYGDISAWDVSHVMNMETMFYFSDFNQDISNWEINPDCNTENMFLDCIIEDKYKPKGVN